MVQVAKASEMVGLALHVKCFTLLFVPHQSHGCICYLYFFSLSFPRKLQWLFQATRPSQSYVVLYVVAL